MKNIALRWVFILFIFLFVGGLVFAGTPVTSNTLLVEAAVLIFGIQLLVFLPSYWVQTEHFYDLTGGITYLSTMGYMAFRHQVIFGAWDLRSLILTVLIGLWAIRLSGFLFTRVKRVGKDGRFDSLKKSFTQFLLTWMLQGLWVFMCTYPALIALASPSKEENILLVVGAIVWVVGWLYEVIADRQKTAFNKDPKNAGQFINVGLWARSRHPNYFGEILLWAGIAVMAIPYLSGTQWVVMLSPLFVYALLTRISGIPTLARRGQQLWGDDPDYQAYLKNTPTLLPRFFGT